MEQFLHGTELVWLEAWLRVYIFTFVDISIKKKPCFSFDFTTKYSNLSNSLLQARYASGLIHYSGFTFVPFIRD